MLPEHAADPPLAQLQFGSNVINASTTPRGAQKFSLAASARIILSIVKSEDRALEPRILRLDILHPLDLIALQPVNSCRQR